MRAVVSNFYSPTGSTAVDWTEADGGIDGNLITICDPQFGTITIKCSEDALRSLYDCLAFLFERPSPNPMR